ncbi:diguanylate cyclase domain-containing protein [Deinococcus roseus]|uniref:Diguanylate cyclase n=1 Tax=Deinococcus roseus TaxID=392414 RepID=A0ABQ2DBZ0_9DEIO|nr:diguanylate cyclase [Deinococcus roseus]GGJ50448.1 hypothetical protein GCM10008938_40450 [Deinococcus roseus]
MPVNEPQLIEERRLEKLYSYGILDTPDETAFDQIAGDISFALDLPTVLISFIDRRRQWFKACIHFDSRETSRQVAFCAYTILSDDPLVVQDALQDERFKDNPLVTGHPHIRAYVGVPLVTPDGHRIGTICGIDYEPRTFTDWDTEMLKRAARRIVMDLEQRLLRSEYAQVMLQLQAIMNASPSGLILLDDRGEITGVNPAASRITGVGFKAGETFHWDGLLKDERVSGREDVYSKWVGTGWFQIEKVELDGQMLPHGQHQAQTLLVIEDVTDHIQHQLYLQDMAFKDQLTLVGNRNAFYTYLRHFMPESGIAVAFIDLDHFKAVNDTFGHHAGDALLREVAQRLTRAVRQQDRVYRLAGDEFTLILQGDIQEQTLRSIAERVMAVLAEPFTFGGNDIPFGASLGIARSQEQDTVDTLLNRADTLMYQVKQQGKNNYLLG